MADKTLNTRILLKYDTYANWTSNNPVLKAGEVAFATITSGNTQEVNSVATPQVLIKVGDGSSAYNALPFVSARSADVYSWAKDPKKPTYSASEITGISDYIADYVETEMGISVDTDTQYQIIKGSDDYTYKLQSKGKGDSAWADVSTISIPKYDDTALTGRVTSLESLVGSTAVATQIANAISALKLGDTYASKDHDHTASEITDFATEVAKVKVANAVNADKAVQDGNGDVIADTYATKTDVGDVSNLSTIVKSSVVGAINELDGGLSTIENQMATVRGNDTTMSMREVAEAVADDMHLYYNSTTKKLSLKGTRDGVAGVTFSEIDVTDFVKDGMLESVVLNDDNDLVLTFNTDAGKEAITIPLDEFIDVYTGDGGIYVSGNVISLRDQGITTAKYQDVSVTKAKLVATVQESLELADSAVQPEDLGTMATETATDYVKKSEATGYDNILTRTEASMLYATTIGLGGVSSIANTAVQTVTADTGLTATKSGTGVTIGFDDTVTFIFDCGDSNF